MRLKLSNTKKYKGWGSGIIITNLKDKKVARSDTWNLELT